MAQWRAARIQHIALSQALLPLGVEELLQGAHVIGRVHVFQAAELVALHGTVGLVEVERSAIPLEEGEVLLADLIGCAVILPDGRAWGTIAEIEVGVQDLLAVQAYLNIVQFVDRRIFRMGIVISALLVVLAIVFVLIASERSIA